MRSVYLYPARSALFFFDAGGGRRFARYCQNHKYDACNWLVPWPEGHATGGDEFCKACHLNRTIPDLSEQGNLVCWREMERAKKRLVCALERFGLSANGDFAQPRIAFDFVRNASTGHSNGVITIDIRESDPVERERAKTYFNEPYRTVLGHLRHESGHYFWSLLFQSESRLKDFRDEFGDERQDYNTALVAYYRRGAPAGWRSHFVSAYASSHPWEDWTETWAHYLHMVASIDTAASEGLEPRYRNLPFERDRPSNARNVYREGSFAELLDRWVPLAGAMVNLTRDMGYADFYPFELSPSAKRKMSFVHDVVRDEAPRKPTPAKELQLV